MVAKAQQGIGKAVEDRAGGEDLAGGAVGEHGTQRAVPEGAAHMGKVREREDEARAILLRGCACKAAARSLACRLLASGSQLH